jgi:serine O-acetyltransferase
MSPHRDIAIDSIVAELCKEAEPILAGHRRMVLPSRERIIEVVEDVRCLFFPGYFGTQDLRAGTLPFHVGSKLDRVISVLDEEICRAVAFAEKHDFATCAHCVEAAAVATRRFAERLPAVRRLVASDVEAAFVGDPALKTRDEAIFAYPGIFAVTNQRIAHELHVAGVPLIPRIITEYAHTLTGIDIHPGARIGERFFIDHGTGVVVGETSVIGNGVRLYQGVTLGAKSFPLDEHGKPIKGIDRHPIVEDDVVIYAGATILGRIVIGKGSSIGGNVWLTHAVPPGSRITQQEAPVERK